MRSWTGSWLSTPPAADFGPGPEAEADGCAIFAFYASRRRLLAFPWGGGGWARSWTGDSFLRLSTPTSGLAQSKRRSGGLRGGESAFIVFPCRPLLPAWLGGHGEAAYGQRVCRGAAEKSGTGSASTIHRFKNYLDFTGSQPMDRDFLACLSWLALWPRWCDT